MKKHTFPLGWIAAVLVPLLCAATAQGDSLELKTGQIVQGKFLGGSPLNIRFQVDGKEQIFATRDVLNIGFSDTSAEAPAPSASPVASAGAAPRDWNPAPDSAPNTQSSALPGYPEASPAPPPNSQPAQAVTIPAGTSVIVRMIDTVDSTQNTVGDPFHASLESDLTAGGTVVAPKGADVYGKLAQAKEAGKISGGAQLTLELTGIRINGNVVPVDSTDYDVAGTGRGKESAERVGGGAILGAIIGGVVGGGKGAAIGAGVGAGAGTGVQLATHGEKIRIPSETLLEFKLEQDVTARSAIP